MESDALLENESKDEVIIPKEEPQLPKKKTETLNDNKKETFSSINTNSKPKSFEVEGTSYRPKYLKDYIGQPNVVATISDPIKKAILTEKPLPHILLCGSYGQGKTTLAKIIANEMDGNFIEISASVKYRDMLNTLKNLKAGDIIFIDEIHKLSSDVVETLLYPAMEDFEIHYTEGSSIFTKTKTQKIVPFTLIGATTETGKLLKPFYSKFPINLTLSEYDLNTIATIVVNSFRSLGITISFDLALQVAKRSRLTPRIANSFVEGISSSAIVRVADEKNLATKGILKDKKAIIELNINITQEDIDNYFKNMKIDELGLKEEDRKILEIIINMYNGGPVGQENLAKALNVSNNRIDQEYEPYLVKLGFINIRPQGRYATKKAYEYLGIKQKDEKDDTKQPDDELPVIEVQKGPLDNEFANRFNQMLVGDSLIYQQALDELFPDVTKNYDSSAKNKAVVKLPTDRFVYCDSKLERRFIQYLFEKGYLLDAKSEALELEYSSQQTDNKKYYPDFVLKLYNNKIAIVEMKNMATIGYHLNIDKYEALKNYCNQNHYLYAEIAKDYDNNRYISVEEMIAKPINQSLLDFINDKITTNGVCSADDLNSFGYKLEELNTILLNDRNLKNIDRVGNNPKIIINN